MFKRTKLTTAILAAAGSLAASQYTVAQESGTIEEVVVTGIRGSLQRAMDVKRDSAGVVDAISAEDMGKFPDTNLAESLQRITGVSINRVNGEGSEVTVRGFGGNFNLVTVNGRQLPSANVTSITGNPLDRESTGSSRSFDFSNLASEGVSGLQVYKTGRAAVPTGGVGATVNIQTMKPLDGQGTKASFGLKAMDDKSGDDVTTEASGLFSWANDDETLGVTIFGSSQERDSGSRGMVINRWELSTWGPDTPANLGMQNATITNTPNDGQLVAMPTNLDYIAAEDERERVNGQLTVQFRPSDDLTLTLDAMYAENTKDSYAVVDGIWFARQWTDVEFDGNPIVATGVKLTEDIDGGKDFYFQSLASATKDELESFGFNADWQVNDNLNLRFDVASSEATSGGNGPLGKNGIRVNVAGATSGWQTVDFSGNFPTASIVIDDSVKGNNNGIFDVPDLGTQAHLSTQSDQDTSTDQFNFDGTLNLDEGLNVDFGIGYMSTEMKQTRVNTVATLGGWGVDSPGEVDEGLITQGCTGCTFEDHDTSGVAGADAMAVPAGSETVALGSISFGVNPVELLNAFESTYGVTLGNAGIAATDDNLVEEDILSAYVQVSLEGELAGMPTNLVLGGRYERTEVDSTTNQAIQTAIIWESDNDFRPVTGSDVVSLSVDHSYENFLPSIDFSIDLSEELKARASFSQTLARPAYNHLFSATSISVPSRPTYLGGAPSGKAGNAKLDPLESNNFDLSLEWYYDESSMLSVGYYRKDVSNFVGTAQVSEPLFGLKDPTSGAPGTLSGDAVDALNDLSITVTERNFFTMAAVLANPDAFPNGAADFEESQEFADAVLSAYDISAATTDPDFLFELTKPINNQSATIYGFEIASQHFFGDTGFGYQANYTTVEGDIGYDVASDPSVDQFALEGLSDSANFVFIYEKHGLSARLAYNWRDTFLDEVNRSVSRVRNPVFVDDYEQWDLNVSYEFSDNLTLSLDVINIGEEGVRHYGRTQNNVFFIQEADTRYVLGLRYTM